jgi:hypothetical protein
MKQYHRGDALVRDFDGLVHPSQIFQHPSEVVGDPDLSLNEKRAILAAWASDACAVEAAPSLRQSPGGRVVSFDEIMDALRVLDRELSATRASHRTASKSRYRKRGSGRSDQGAPLQ